MNLKYLVETDWAVNYLRKEEHTVRKLQEFQKEGIGLSIISLAELYSGVYRSKNPHKAEMVLNDFLAGVTLLPVDKETARIFGEKYAELSRDGILIGDFDLLIASTCLRYELILLTNNRRHFERIKDILGR